LKPLRQIVALGGGAFSMEQDGLLDKYILNLIPKEIPEICFVGSASNDGEEYREMFYNFYKRFKCEPSHLSLADPPDDIEEFILEKDIIHVGGGNTKLLMDLWKKHGLVKIFRKAWEKGIVLTGMSAGAICWFEDGITNPSAGKLERLECTGFLPGSFCPHYDDKVELKRIYHRLIIDGNIDGGFGVEDGAAVHFIGARPLRVITSRPFAKAYRVKRSGKEIVEEPMDSLYLGSETDKDNYEKSLKKLEALKTVNSFIEKINEHDIEGLAGLMTGDHIFIDSMGIIAKGKDFMKKAWEGYLDWFPDYEIKIDYITLNDETAGLFGKARGTFSGKESNGKNNFELNAAWRAKVEDGKISEWQVYADNEEVREIIAEGIINKKNDR
jgi:dipeptidase E